jgi:nucleoside-diphosphate-sugar epimerase
VKIVLVTGASGFIGSNAIATLVEMGYEVHAISSRDLIGRKHIPGLIWSKVNLFNFHDVASYLGRIKATHLLHFAWYAEHGKFWDSVENYGWMYATNNLVQSFINCGGRRFVISGSCAEYDWKQSKYVENESVIGPSTLYGQIKNLTRISVENIAKENNISYGWGRIFYLYGSGESAGRLVPVAIDCLSRGERLKCTDGKQLRDYMHVQDVARAFCLFLDGEVNGVVNIASGKSVEIRKIISIVAGHFGARKLVDFGALKSRESEPNDICADITRLKNEVGFKERWTLREGILNTVDQAMKCSQKNGRSI